MYMKHIIGASFFLTVARAMLISQIDSYCREHESEVVSCDKNGSVYHVICDNTIFHPTSDGQQCDRGTLGGVKVVNVIRVDRDEVVHVLEQPVKESETVEQIIDWPFRFDQMQVHTAQHLVSAVIEQQFGYQSVSWDAGPEICKMELETNFYGIYAAELAAIEAACNKMIMNGTKVQATWYGHRHPGVLKSHKVDFPKDYAGEIRIFSIDGLTNATCYGTHVTSLSELQMIRILRTTRFSNGRYYLYYTVGNRLLKKLQEMYNREQEVCSIVQANSTNVVDLVETTIENTKKQGNYLGNVLKQLAALEAKAADVNAPYVLVYRREGDASYANCYLKVFQSQPIHSHAILVIITGEDPDGSLLVFKKSGEAEDMAKVLCAPDVLDGVGRARGTLYFARVKSPENHLKAMDAIEKYLHEPAANDTTKEN